MRTSYRVAGSGALFLGLGFLCACPFDTTLREYLSAQFWFPFTKRPASFEEPSVRRINAPYAGMDVAGSASPLGRLRAAYQAIIPATSQQDRYDFDAEALRHAVAAARTDTSLTREEKEEVNLIDAKIDLREGEPDDETLLLSARRKLLAFLRVSHTPKFRSEARGWLARTDYLLGDQTAAGKIYLDELNRNGSNLSRETLLNSLRINYGYNGGQELLDHLDEYFDTPEHAAFAIQLVTNPGEPGDSHPLRGEDAQPFEKDRLPNAYPRIKSLLQEHATLFQSNAGSQALALLTMRTALRMGDPTGAKEMSEEIPASATVRADPDFNWMLASALFLSHDYAGAEQPLLALFHSSRASSDQQAAAAYGLCGVYRKTGNVAEQIRFALWLNARQKEKWAAVPLVADLTVYWAGSGWDLGLLLDAEASIDAIRSFVDRNPDLTGIPLVKYSLAVRLARENRYGEAAELYRSIGAIQRASRMERISALYEAANRAGLADHEAREARYEMAAFLSANPETIYFNGRLWSGFQRYALQASRDSRLTRAEREEQLARERKLKDDQEERWRAYLIFRDIAQAEGRTALGRKAALAGLHCLRGISERFERGDEIRKADLELTRWLR